MPVRSGTEIPATGVRAAKADSVQGRSLGLVARRVGLCAGALVIIGSSAPAQALGAASTTQAASFPTGWAWSAQRSQAPSLAAWSGVPADDQAVGWAAQPDKISYLGLAVPRGTQVDSARLVAYVDQDANNVNVAAATLQACVIISPWTPAAAMAWDTKPLTSCADAAPGAQANGGTEYDFDLTTVARDLAAPSGGVYGISLEPAPSASQPFQVALRAVVATVTQTSALGPTVEGQSPSVASPATPRVLSATLIPTGAAPRGAPVAAQPMAPSIAIATTVGGKGAELLGRIPTASAITADNQAFKVNAAFGMLALLGAMPVLAQVARACTATTS